MFNTPWNDSWVMPSTQSYMAQLVADAGADYIYKENDSNSSTPIGLETAYGLIQKADYWINVGSAKTLDELKAVNPKFADAKAVHEKTVYNNNLRPVSYTHLDVYKRQLSWFPSDKGILLEAHR